MADAKPIARFGLVGSGHQLVQAIEALTDFPNAVIAVVSDASGESAGARLARSLGIQVAASPTDVFRTNADVILELNGSERQYERLLAVKPTGVEVMSARGARLLIDLFRQNLESPHGETTVTKAVIIVAEHQRALYDYLRRGFAGIRDVEVLAERRKGERRQRLRAHAGERRQAKRRQEAGVDSELRARGFLVSRHEIKPAED